MRRTTVKHIANEVNLHPNTIRNWCDKGILQHNRTITGIRWFTNKCKAINKVNKLLGIDKCQKV